MTPDLVIVGHIAKDITDDGWRAGGSVLYAATQAQRLGLKVAALTACAADIDPASILPGVDWRVVSSHETTTFANIYSASERNQRLMARAEPLQPTDLPEAWLKAPLVLLAPLFHDFDASLVAAFNARNSMVASSIQGWLRATEADRVVSKLPQDRPWQGSDIVFTSEEDILDITAIQEMGSPLILVQTRADQGCSVWDTDGRHDLPAIETRAVDPTGAGDVFSAAFLVRFSETGESLEAARFATAAASFAIEGQGIEAIAARSAIEARLAREVTAPR